MSSSPYLPIEIKEYIVRHNIEGLIKDAVDQLLKEKKEDPYSFLMSYFGKLSQSSIILEGIQAYEVLNNECLPTIQLNFKVLYKSVQSECSPDVHFNISNDDQKVLQQLYQSLMLKSDGDQNRYQGKGMLQVIQLLDKIAPMLIGRNIAEASKIDEILLQNNTINLIQPISYSLITIQSHLLSQPVYQIHRQLFSYKPQQYLPKLFINLLQGSKLVGSKCKVFRFILTIQDQTSTQHVLNYTQSVLSNLRKTLASGKLGESGIKFHQDGTFICPADTIADNLKIIETAIEQAQLKDKVGVGIVWMADLFYNAEQKKYELENPKQLYDVDMLIDYYLKLCSERPIITYMEDPIKSDDNAGWQKILMKFNDHKVKIGSRRLYCTLEDTKRLTDIVTKETYPELSEEEIHEQHQRKILLPYVHLRPYDYPVFTQFVQIVQLLLSKKPTPIIILGDTFTDSTDTQIVDLAYAMPNGGLNMTSPSKYEKIIKMSRYLLIGDQ